MGKLYKCITVLTNVHGDLGLQENPDSVVPWVNQTVFAYLKHTEEAMLSGDGPGGRGGEGRALLAHTCV
jgi:hypothetical protein